MLVGSGPPCISCPNWNQFCHTIRLDLDVEVEDTNYTMSVDFINLSARDQPNDNGKIIGHPGLAFNYIDDLNYDVVHVR